jgi:predicted GNAT family acetyltransferase
MIRVHRPPDARSFLAEAGSFLGEREAENNLLLGICSSLLRDPSPFDEGPAYLAIVEDDGRVIGAALRTPPHNLVLSESDDPSWIRPVVVDARNAMTSLPGVIGPSPAASAFARGWCELAGGEATRRMANRIYRAATATPPAGVPGAMRAYREDERTLTIGWLDAFVREAFPDEATNEPSDAILNRRLADPDGDVRFWDVDGAPVSLASFGQRTPNGIRVGPVYTPPGLRGNGYASALVGQMTEELLGLYRYCFLFTDLANPTANGIYQRIGYEAVSDVEHYAFV